MKARRKIRPLDNLRRQHIDAETPFDYHIAADARMSRADYADDQVWRVELGARLEPALAFLTEFGGRADLVSLTPRFRIGDTLIHQAFAFARQPIITRFAPNLVQVEAALTDAVELVARFWAMESRAAGGEFALANRSEDDIPFQLELLGEVRLGGRKRRLNVLTLADGTLALHLGEIGDINPVVTLEDASHEIYGGRIRGARLGARFTLPAGHQARIPFVCAGMNDMRDSFSLAMNWMSRSWDRHYAQIDKLANATPLIDMGNAAWNRVIDLSFALALKAFMGASDSLPHSSFVAMRAGNRGWSRRGTGRDHIRGWAGQDARLAYMLVSALATVDGELAKGIARNYLAVQDEDGSIDSRPGLAGQREGALLMPILARMAWRIHLRTDDHDFIAEVAPALRKFYARWFADDMDTDKDGTPEWQSERQMGYVAFPTFGQGRGWAQGADIRHFESPDLLAYLISEAGALRDMAEVSQDDETQAHYESELTRLETALEEMWVGDRYGYRDRDTRLHGESVELLRGGAGDQRHDIDTALRQPARVVMRVVGGVSQRPQINMTLQGADIRGMPCELRAQADDFHWQNRQGIFTTPQPLTAVHSIHISGLSRVYKVYARTLDTSRLDINALLPLWTGRLPQERAENLVALAMDEGRFLRPNGLTMVAASDPSFDPSNARGGGGIWMAWLALVGEGMIAAGFHAEANDLLRRTLDHLARVLEREGRLAQFYHADAIQGLGEPHHIGGIAPLSLLSDALGIQIRGADTVAICDYRWGESVRIEQHGVIVSRNADGTDITFPSGHRVNLPADAPSQLVIDPTAQPPAVDDSPAPPESPPVPADPDAGTVVIDVDDGANED